MRFEPVWAMVYKLRKAMGNKGEWALHLAVRPNPIYDYSW